MHCLIMCFEELVWQHAWSVLGEYTSKWSTKYARNQANDKNQDLIIGNKYFQPQVEIDCICSFELSSSVWTPHPIWCIDACYNMCYQLKLSFSSI